jgi:hypothetical protein
VKRGPARLSIKNKHRPDEIRHDSRTPQDATIINAPSVPKEKHRRDERASGRIEKTDYQQKVDENHRGSFPGRVLGEKSTCGKGAGKGVQI